MGEGLALALIFTPVMLAQLLFSLFPVTVIPHIFTCEVGNIITLGGYCLSAALSIVNNVESPERRII